jgi:hypothetical protein
VYLAMLAAKRGFLHHIFLKITTPVQAKQRRHHLAAKKKIQKTMAVVPIIPLIIK